MSYQAWEDLLEDGDGAPTRTASPGAETGAGKDAGAGLDAEVLLREAPALAELLRQRGELERRMASLLGQEPDGAAGSGARERLRVGAPPATAAQRAAVRLAELDDLARRETVRQRAVLRRAKDESEALRRKALVDRGRRKLLAQQRRLEDAERRLLEHRLEQTAQRWSGARPEGEPRKGPGHALADVVDRARAPLREYEGQREQLRAQLREQLAKAKQDPQLQEELREDPTALDDLDDLGADLDEALALPDAWVERLDARAEQWSQRLRTADTWKGRDGRLGVDDVLDALARLDGLRERKRERAQSERKDQRAEERADARRREREHASSRDDSERRQQRSSSKPSDDQPRRRRRTSVD